MNLTFRMMRILSRGLLAGALMTAAITASEAAALDASDSKGFTALTYDIASGELLKASGHALFRSGDDGKSWTAISLPARAAGPIDAIAAPATSKQGLYIAGPQMGVWRSTDNGAHWLERSKGLPGANVTTLTVHATQAETLYAYSPHHGIFRSEDAGETWRLMDQGPKEGLGQLIHSNMPGSMQTGWLFAATKSGVRRIMDCFCLWEDAGKLGRAVNAIAYDQSHPSRLVAAGETNLMESEDGGQSWNSLPSPSSNIASLAFGRSGELYAMNSAGALFRSADAGRSWEQVSA